MAITRGRELVSQSNPNPDEIRKSIRALIQDANHVQRCMNAGVRDYASGEATVKEISDLIKQLEQKL